jgi:hypothetical protein
MQNQDRFYYGERAEAEIEAAHQANHPAAARAHYVLAAYYLDLAHNPDARVVTYPISTTVAAQLATRQREKLNREGRGLTEQEFRPPLQQCTAFKESERW